MGLFLALVFLIFVAEKWSKKLGIWISEIPYVWWSKWFQFASFCGLNSVFPRSGSLEPWSSVWQLFSVVWGSGLSGDPLHTEALEGLLGPQCFINIQEALNILDIPRVLGALCQKSGRENTCVFFVWFVFAGTGDQTLGLMFAWPVALDHWAKSWSL